MILIKKWCCPTACETKYDSPDVPSNPNKGRRIKSSFAYTDQISARCDSSEPNRSNDTDSTMDISVVNTAATMINPSTVIIGRFVNTKMIGNVAKIIDNAVIRLAVKSAIPIDSESSPINIGRKELRFQTIIASPIKGADNAKSIPI